MPLVTWALNTLTAAATYTTLISYPLIPTSFAFSSPATVRIQ